MGLKVTIHDKSVSQIKRENPFVGSNLFVDLNVKLRFSAELSQDIQHMKGEEMQDVHEMIGEEIKQEFLKLCERQEEEIKKNKLKLES